MKTNTNHAYARRLLLTAFLILGGGVNCSSFGADIRYRVVNLQATAPDTVDWSDTKDINEHGDVVGYYYTTTDYLARIFVYTDKDGFKPLPEREAVFSFPYGINNQGQVAVFSGVPGQPDLATAFRHTPGIGYEWLGSLGDASEDVPRGINNLGQVIGRSDSFSGKQEAFLYTDGAGMESISPLHPAASARAINDSGWVTGTSSGNVFLWTRETGMVAIGQGVGEAINNSGVVAGCADGPGQSEAAIFANEGTQLLGNLGGLSSAYGINDYNVVVGDSDHSWSYPALISAFVWTEAEGLVNLNSLIPTNQSVYGAWAINNHGQIAASGGGGVAVRLDPIPSKLAMKQSGTNMVVSWSPAWPGVVLEGAENLNGASWGTVTTGGTNYVTVPLTNQMRFFRLNLDALRGLCCAPD